MISPDTRDPDYERLRKIAENPDEYHIEVLVRLERIEQKTRYQGRDIENLMKRVDILENRQQTTTTQIIGEQAGEKEKRRIWGTIMNIVSLTIAAIAVWVAIWKK